MNLRVKLRDGFRNDTVTIRVNGQEVYHKSNISTDLTISFADAVDIPVEENILNLEVGLATGQTVTKEIYAVQTPFVEVWINEGRIELRESDEETPML